MGNATTKTARSPTKAKTKPKATIAKSSQLDRPHEQEVMNRLRRVEGQIRGILVMMEEQKSCEAIAQQLAAARKALDRAFYEMMACSLEMEINDTASNIQLCDRIAEKTKLLAKYA